MEENNLSFILGQTSPLDSSFSIDPSFSIPITNTFMSPLLEEIMSALMENSIPTIHSSFSPPINRTPQFLIGNQHNNSQIAFMPTAYLSSLICLNDMATSIGLFPTTNQVPVAANSSNTLLPLFQRRSLPFQNSRNLYNLRREVPPQPWLQPLPLTNLFNFRTHASYSIGFSLSNPYLINPNPNYLCSIGNTSLDVTWNRLSLFQDVNRVFQYKACRVEFPSSQAYGGHMSSHNKTKRARENLEATMREAKKARPTVETSSLDLSNITGISMVAKEEEVLEEVPTKDDVPRKVKNIALVPLKGAEEIQTEILGYISNESMNSGVFQ